jgi:hypothetical protein
MRNNYNALECRTRHFLHTLSTVNIQAEVGCDSSVGIATRYGMDGPGIESRCWAIFSATIQKDERCLWTDKLCLSRDEGM